MPDFTALLKRPAGVAKRQPPLPAFDYPAIIKSWEPGENQKTKNGYVRFSVGLTGWPDSLPESARVDSDGNELDPTKKTFRMDFYVTDDALVMLDEFIRACGVPMSDDGTSLYEEVIPLCIGARCVATVQQAMNESTNEIYNPPWLKSLRGSAA